MQFTSWQRREIRKKVQKNKMISKNHEHRKAQDDDVASNF